MTAPSRVRRAHGGGRAAHPAGRGTRKEVDRMGIMDPRGRGGAPTPEELVARSDAWFERHPVLGGALFVVVFTGLVPAMAALGLLS